MTFCAELIGISKSFGSVQANQDVSLSIREGSIHALVGENGAGKSTSMKILFGLIQPDSGRIIYKGKEVSARGKQSWNPQLAFEAGVGMVHQHFMLAQNETVLDNLVLGVEECHLGFRKRKKEREELSSLMQKTGFVLPLDAPLSSLSVGMQSRCEILKVLYRKAKFLILDEPTAVLTPHEIEEFLRTLKNLRAQGNTVLIVTHKLKEVMEVADEATVLRGGKTIATREISKTSVEELSELMVGRRLVMPKVSTFVAKPIANAFEMKDESFSLRLNPGEIVGIAGVEGNGQENLAKLIVSHFMNSSEDEAREKLAVIPADRHHEGLVLDFSLFENLRLSRRFHPRKKAWEYFAPVTKEERDQLAYYDVRPALPEVPASALSGGNQQKLIVARELSGQTSEGVVLAIHPTRGVDLGAIEFIHSQLIKAAEKGAAVVLISSELEELMALSHRIGVVYSGKICEWFDGRYDEKKIGQVMLSGSAKEASA